MNRSTVLAVISAAVAVMMFVPAAYSATTSTSVESQDNVIGIIPVPVETVIDANGGSSVISGTGGDYHLVESEDGGVYVQKDENDPDHEVGSGNFDVTLKMPANSKFYIKVVYAPDYGPSPQRRHDSHHRDGRRHRIFRIHKRVLVFEDLLLLSRGPFLGKHVPLRDQQSGCGEEQRIVRK